MRTFTIKQASSAKLTRQKSTFYAHIIPVKNVNECKRKIKKVKDNHKADHFPFAYHITAVDTKGDIATFIRQNDDGEPSHTAGNPLQNLIEQQNLTNVVIVIARVFGGVKLGPSGLTRAFRESALMALEDVQKTRFRPTIEYAVMIAQEQANKYAEFCRQNKLKCSFEKTPKQLLCTINIPLEKRALLEVAQNL